ncbi:hypothetical protein ABZO31_00700 [Streptomyces sp. HUAS MG47]
MLAYGKAVAVCVVDNEDGAHHVSAEHATDTRRSPAGIHQPSVIQASR